MKRIVLVGLLCITVMAILQTSVFAWWPDAARPHVRAALRTALLPQIESTKVVGLVALPGAMTGLILAGVKPVDAVKVQAAVMFLILGGVSVTVTVVARGLTRRLFTPDHRLRRLVREAS